MVSPFPASNGDTYSLPMYHLLSINNEFLNKMSSIFTASSCEEGFLLGCSDQIDHITNAAFLPSLQSSQNHYTPNPKKADEIIQNWAAHQVCFCGFIHSHVTQKHELSEADLQFASRLIKTYKLPVLWFGLAVINGGHVSFHFYAVAENRNGIDIFPVFLSDNTILKENTNESLHC